MFVRYDLVRGSATLAEMKHDQLFEELASLANVPVQEVIPWTGACGIGGMLAHKIKMKVQFLAGGATLNSIRVAQWLLQASFPDVNPLLADGTM